MSNIEIRKVETLHELKVFIQFFYDLYRDNPCAVPYLYGEEMKTLRKDKNPAFAFCEALEEVIFEGDTKVDESAFKFCGEVRMVREGG